MLDRPGLFVDFPRTYTNIGGECDINNSVRGHWILKPSRPHREYKVGNFTFDLPEHHVGPDQTIVNFLINISQAHSILELGAGVGQYARSILFKNPNTFYTAYDGAENLDRYSLGLVQQKYLDVPQQLPMHDWVVSLEVGEHIPHTSERCFVSNLHRHNREGIILSWVILGQFGYGHVNNHSPKYILKLFNDLGYGLNIELTNILRKSVHYPWFKRSLYILQRREGVQNYVSL
jgi:2-polyprenyl-3-methyl-5-hydroxy-6-metoxy-1,4-benzoquinol methylase